MCNEDDDHEVTLNEMLNQADEYFGNRDATTRWLQKPNLAFQGKAPLSFCDSLDGIYRVTEELNKLKHGYTA